MAALTFLPLDLKGNKPTNRIRNEVRTLVKIPDRPHRVLLPRMGAFYADKSLRITDNGKLLTLGVDYTTTYLYPELSKLASLPIYALIVVVNPTVGNTLNLEYQAVGGPFGLSVDEIEKLLDDIANDDTTFKFEDIINKPKAYNPKDHVDEYWQLYGTENTVTVINRIGDLVETDNTGLIEALNEYSLYYYGQAQLKINDEIQLLNNHLRDTNNPHKDTKAHVGLNLINNWRMATAQEHTNANNSSLYATAQGGQYVIRNNLTPYLTRHLTDTKNPHKVRASDVESYTRAEQNTRLNTLLNRSDPAYNSDKMFGYTPAQYKERVNSNLPASAVTSGLFNPARIGNGVSGTDTILMGGTWRKIEDLVNEAYGNVSIPKLVSIRSNQASTTAEAIAHANTVLGNLTAYPVGSKAIYHMRNNPRNTPASQVEIKVLIRNASGWASFIP